jgi:hypothetical protein
MSFRKGMRSPPLSFPSSLSPPLSKFSCFYIGQGQTKAVTRVLSVSVNIIIWVLAVVLFLLVLHHNFLSLSSLLKNDISGMAGSLYLTNSVLLSVVKDLEVPGPNTHTHTHTHKSSLTSAGGTVGQRGKGYLQKGGREHLEFY